MEHVNDLVGFNNLKICQNDDWFKFSLESILLPNFVTINMRVKTILDLCSGNAPIPLILSQRTKSSIVGVEIQKDVYDLALKSIKLNHLEKQITMINDNTINLKHYFNGDSFDVITVNPPYFVNHHYSLKNHDIHKTYARHEIAATLEDILKMASFLLKNNGYIALVHRTERFFEIIKKMEEVNLIPKRVQFIYPKVGKNSNLVMIEGVKNGHEGVQFLDPLYIHNEDGTYKEEIKKIMHI